MDPISNGRNSILPLNLQLFADPAGGAGGEGGGEGGTGGNPAGNDPANGGAGGEGGTGGEGSKGGNDPAKDLAAQCERDRGVRCRKREHREYRKADDGHEREERKRAHADVLGS